MTFMAWLGAYVLLTLGAFRWLERSRRRKATRDARQIIDEAVALVDRRAARAAWTADEGTDCDLDSSELGIGAAVLPIDARLRSCEGTAHFYRKRGRVLRPAPWLVGDDCADYGRSVSLIVPKPKRWVH